MLNLRLRGICATINQYYYKEKQIDNSCCWSQTPAGVDWPLRMSHLCDIIITLGISNIFIFIKILALYTKLDNARNYYLTYL